MAEGLLSKLFGMIDRQKQTTKAGIGLLADSPIEFAKQTTARYLPTKEEEAQFKAIQSAGGDFTQTPYFQKVMELSQFQGSIKPLSKTQFDIANEDAQKYAVEMLGLPANNTAADRAKALGYDTPAYHATNRQFEQFSNKMLGAKTGAKSAKQAHFSASDPELTNTYVNLSHVNPLPWKSSPPVYENLIKNKEAFKEFNAAPDDVAKWMVLEKYGMNYGSGQVMPLILNLGKTKVKDYQGVGYRDETYNDLLKLAKKSKKDSVVFKNTYDPGPHQGSNVQSDVYAVFDPSRIRSKFAAFDPRRIDAETAKKYGVPPPDLLAAGLPLGLLAGTEVEMPKKQQKKPKK